MAYEQRVNSGILFRNDKKGNPKAPDLTGNALLQLDDGTLVQLEVAAWTRPTRTGGKFLGLSIKPKGQQLSRSSQQPAQGNVNAARGRIDYEDAVIEDDIPFGKPSDEERW
jgi:hypothetical protein